MTRMFGTDGIRGRALKPPLDEATLRKLGFSLARELATASQPHVLLAGDTRASTRALAVWIAEGFQAAGGTVTWAGVLPTPAVSHLLRQGGYSAGVVISASHNPADDNGVKVLAASGEKAPEAVERRLEYLLETVRVTGVRPGMPAVDRSLKDRYLQIVERTHARRHPLAGMHIVVDAAHGAASGLATELLHRLGARVTEIACSPDGTNINLECGATAPGRLAEEVVSRGADGGLALDGDADRAILVDERGSVLDGDDILLAWARQLKDGEKLPGRRIVATVMSNFGLEAALARDGIELIRSPVGDRSVWEAMRANGAVLGGEQSGHIICSHHGVTGDGLITGSHVLAIASMTGRPVSMLSDLVRVPQVLINVPVSRKEPFERIPGVQRVLTEAQSQLEGRGRVLLRYSGTEPLARVMVEGDEDRLIRRWADELAQAIDRALG
ncbi:MAG: phosphoglucosamine mutase [Acidobacteria bacterium]|nr:phosphoglucosamine mutase [Acidobacteriota bacterium]